MDECGLWSAAPGAGQGAGRAGGRAAGRVAGHPPDRRGGQQRGRLGGGPGHRVRRPLPRRARACSTPGSPRNASRCGCAPPGSPGGCGDRGRERPGNAAPPPRARAPAWRVALSLFTVIPAGVGGDLDEGAAARAVFWLPVIGAGLGLAGSAVMVFVAAGECVAGTAVARCGPGDGAARGGDRGPAPGRAGRHRGRAGQPAARGPGPGDHAPVRRRAARGGHAGAGAAGPGVCAGLAAPRAGPGRPGWCWPR